MAKKQAETTKKLSSKRSAFINSKTTNIARTSPFGILGYYPLYDNIDDAIKNSPDSDYHTHEFDGVEYYMSNGLEMGVTQFHGDWTPESTDIVLEATEAIKVIEPPEAPEITVEPEKPEITYTPPPSPPDRS
jgi:hypothetical protein